MDAVDRKILAVVQEDASLSVATVPLKNVTSRFAMERIKSTTALPLGETR